MAIQIGKYKRPGIFIEEFDNSIITNSPTLDGINTLVVGFSKKGPINTPVRLTNTNDLDGIFGSIDRGLERKGSFFHRTISKMLQSSPVYAINLLATDDDLDKIQYKSLSAASDKNNGELLTDSYRKFFNTTGFWKRDTESFLSLTKNDTSYNDVVLNLTNISDKPISIFVFKTKLKGFDRTLVEWYGTSEKVPPYLNVNDYASDYMVDVVVVGGDWSNYSVLSVDNRWSKYFDSTGLIKSKVSEFANDRNINLLAYYEGLSLVPYFKDSNGRNIFIESVVNRDTDKTGLFCSFNIDLFETDYPKGMVDLIGNNLVGVENSTIDFLSYKDTLSEVVTYGNVPLDKVGNTLAIVSASFSSFRSSPIAGRTAIYSEGYISGVTSSLGTVAGGTVSFNVSYNNPYAIIGGKLVTVDTSATTFNIGTSSFSTLGATYTSAIVLRSTGIVEKVVSTSDTKPLVGASDLVLGYASFYVNSFGTFSNATYTNVYTKSSGYNELTFGATSGDYYISASGSNVVVTFNDTAATPSLRNYEQYRRIKYFNSLTSLLSSPTKNQMTMIVNGSTLEKISLKDITVSNIITSTTSNKSFTLSGLSGYPSIVTNGLLVFYSNDDEFVISGTSEAKTLVTGLTAANAAEGKGIVARYSDFYLDYLNGRIGTGDYFYTNSVSGPSTGSSPSTIGDAFTVQFSTYGATSYVVLDTTTGDSAFGWPQSSFVQSGDLLMFPDSTLNKGSLTVNDTHNHSSLFGGDGTGNDGIYAFAVEETVVSETILSVKTVYNLSLKHYLSMYIDSSDKLFVEFTDQAGDSLPLTNNIIDEISNCGVSFDVFSNKLNYKQTVEVVYPSGYTQQPNKVLVEASRYTEVKIGDFLEAYVDNSSLRSGEVARKLTRILSKKYYPSDTTLVEIVCDARIATKNLGSSQSPDWQTTRYTNVEDYVSTYKSITLAGFKVREASIPDGTEERQTEILNLVAKGTPIFKALTNKEAIDFRYVVDSFGLGLIERSKQQLVDICGDRLDCFGFINMPSMKQFKASATPSFVNSDGVLDTSFIAQGGDPESNPSFYYSFGEGDGTTCTGYFLPYLVIGDNGRPLDVPPAMFAATTYMRKHNSNFTSIVPWTIAAGVTNGKVTGFENVEMDFTVTDIENLNQAQMNPIVYKRNRGFVIETENTGLTLYKSALSYIHVREVLIELERELSRMLLDFQWKFNTPEVRAEIKLRADVICEQYVSKNGLYNYFNKCDDENNTSNLIDNQIGVIDTYVEAIRGMGIIVNNITILRTGAIQSGGFIQS